ncbi:4734_t:CDS:1, partial [Ambispora leptoticha]
NAVALIKILNHQNVFPPLLNDPENLIPPEKITEDGTLQPRRPQNAFFIFRQNVIHEARRFKISNMRLISKAASIMWQNANKQDIEVYKQLAAQVSALHRQKYPSFKYASARSNIVFRRQSKSSPAKALNLAKEFDPSKGLNLPNEHSQDNPLLEFNNLELANNNQLDTKISIQNSFINHHPLSNLFFVEYDCMPPNMDFVNYPQASELSNFNTGFHEALR